MPVSFSFEMKVIMAQLVLNNPFQFFQAKLFQIFAVDFDMVGPEHVPAPRSSQTIVEICFVAERFLKMFERYFFHQSLQFQIVHNPTPDVCEQDNPPRHKLLMLQ